MLDTAADHEDVRGSGILDIGIGGRRFTGRFTPGGETSPYPPNSTLGGPQNWSGCSEEETSLFAPAGNRTVI